jgi:hypothetical protein
MIKQPRKPLREPQSNLDDLQDYRQSRRDSREVEPRPIELADFRLGPRQQQPTSIGGGRGTAAPHAMSADYVGLSRKRGSPKNVVTIDLAHTHR